MPPDRKSHYRLDVTVKDGQSKTGGTIGHVDAPAEQQINAGSRLQYFVSVTAQGAGHDPLLFASGDQKWKK